MWMGDVAMDVNGFKKRTIFEAQPVKIDHGKEEGGGHHPLCVRWRSVTFDLACHQCVKLVFYCDLPAEWVDLCD